MKIPDASMAFNRLSHIPSTANRSAAKAYLVEKDASGRVKPQSLLAITDPIVALGKRLGDKPWMQATREEVITCIRDHTFRRGEHRAKTPGTPKPLAATTKHQWWSYLKGFYRYLNDEEMPRFLRRTAFPKPNALQERGKVLAIDPEDLAKLLAGATSVRDRCLLLFLLETGFRVSEAAALRLKDMEDDGATYWFELPKGAPFLKTNVREVPVGVTKGRDYLEAWLHQHPRRHDPEARLFVTLSNRSYAKPLDGPAISEIVCRAARRGGIDIHAHMLRHTSASLKIVAGWSPEAIRLTHGWTTLEMLEQYSHVQGHYKDMVRRANGLPMQDKAVHDHMGSRKCQICGQVNPITVLRCKVCKTDASQAGQIHAQRRQTAMNLDFVVPYAVQAFQDVLIIAIARARGFPEALA